MLDIKVVSVLLVLGTAAVTCARTPLQLDPEIPQIFEQLPFCDRSFAVLKRCSAELGNDGVKCCNLLNIFMAQGCKCPGCDEQEDTKVAEELESRGMLWMLELAPLLDLCTASAAESLRGEASLRASLSLEAPSITHTLTQLTLNGKDRPTVTLEDITTTEVAASQSGRSLASSSSANGGDATVGSNDFGEGEWEFENDDDRYEVDLPDIDDSEAEEWTEDLLEALVRGAPDPQVFNLKKEAEQNGYGSEDEDDTMAWGIGAQGVVTRSAPAHLHQQSASWVPARAQSHRSADMAALLEAKVVPSSEDFPLTTDAELALGQHAQQQQQQEEPGGEVVLHRTRTVTLDIELTTDTANTVAEIAGCAAGAAEDGQQGRGCAGMHTLSRKIDIDTELEAPRGSTGAVTLGERIMRWLPRMLTPRPISTAAQDSPEQQKQLLLDQLAWLHSSALRRVETKHAEQAQQQEDACRCVGMQLPPYPPEGKAYSLAYYHYVSARLALCQFACRQRNAIMAAVVLEIAMLVVYVVALLLRRAREGAVDGAAKQFVVCAADEEWKQPLLMNQS